MTENAFNVDFKPYTQMTPDELVAECENWERRLSGAQARIDDLNTSYNNLNVEYSRLMNRHTDLQVQYDDCAGKIGVDVDRLAQSEQMLSNAQRELDYTSKALENKGREATLWQQRAEGCQADKDSLLTALDEAKISGSKGATKGDAPCTKEEWDLAGDAVLALMDMGKTFMQTIRPGMNEDEVNKLKFAGAKVLMVIVEKLDKLDHKH